MVRIIELLKSSCLKWTKTWDAHMEKPIVFIDIFWVDLVFKLIPHYLVPITNYAKVLFPKFRALIRSAGKCHV